MDNNHNRLKFNKIIIPEKTETTWDLFIYFFFNIDNKPNFVHEFKDTHREKVPSNKTPALTKIANMGICLVGTPNQHFIRGSKTETKFSKK